MRKQALLKHQTFEVITTFDDEPSIEEVYQAIQKHYNKTVVGYERLDNENFSFKFDDDSNIELLLRNTD